MRCLHSWVLILWQRMVVWGRISCAILCLGLEFLSQLIPVQSLPIPTHQRKVLEPLDFANCWIVLSRVLALMFVFILCLQYIHAKVSNMFKKLNQQFTSAMW